MKKNQIAVILELPEVERLSGAFFRLSRMAVVAGKGNEDAKYRCRECRECLKKIEKYWS